MGTGSVEKVGLGYSVKRLSLNNRSDGCWLCGEGGLGVLSEKAELEQVV